MKRKLILSSLVLTALLASAVAYKFWQLDGQSPNWWRVVRTETGGQPTYEPIQYRAQDNRPAISEPEFVGVDQATMAGGTMGMGVNINGDTRFYPLHILAYHQIVNDTCGGTEIACTY